MPNVYTTQSHIGPAVIRTMPASTPEYYDTDDFLHLAPGFEQMERFEESLNASGLMSGEVDEITHPVWPGSHPGLAVNENIFVQPFASSAMAEKYYPVHIYIRTDNAFGDGSHPTTRICMRFLYEHINRMQPDEKRERTVIDVGAGTGVLSILAALLGMERIDAIELHEKAVKTARENFVLNNCGWINIFPADISRFDGARSYDIVLANMVSDVIIPNLHAISGLAVSGGTLIVSGISDARAAEAEEGFIREELTIADHISEDGWNGYLLKKGRRTRHPGI